MTNRTKEAARKATARAIRSGKLTRPDTCSRCDQATTIQAHHTDYEKPLEVIWLCRTCHWAEHAGERKGQGRPTRPLPDGNVTPKQLGKAEADFQNAQARAETARERRNGLVIEALAEGWTHAQIATATGMTRGRVGQIGQGALRNA